MPLIPLAGNNDPGGGRLLGVSPAGVSGWKSGDHAMALGFANTTGCCFRQARRCSDNNFAGLFKSVLDFPTPMLSDVFLKRTEDGQCYVFNHLDGTYDCSNSRMLFGASTPIASCVDTLCGGAGDGNPCTQPGCPQICDSDFAGNPIPCEAPVCSEGCVPTCWLCTFSGVLIPSAATCDTCTPGVSAKLAGGSAVIGNTFSGVFPLRMALSVVQNGGAPVYHWQYVRDNADPGPWEIQMNAYTTAGDCTGPADPTEYFEISLVRCSNGFNTNGAAFELLVRTSHNLGPWNHFYSLATRASCGGTFTMNNQLAGTGCRSNNWIDQCLGVNDVGGPTGTNYGGEIWGTGGTAVLTACGC